MKRLADGVWMLRGIPPNAINVYLLEDVLLDAGTRMARRRIFAELNGRTLAAHALTHVHADHQGASRAVCEAWDVPLWCGRGDADAMESGDWSRQQPPSPLAGPAWRLFAGPPHPVARRLREGDEVAGFRVLETPGHAPGHVAFWREADRVLVVGDVLNNIHTLTGIPGLREPLKAYTPDPVTNRASARRLGELEPALVLFGHGAPLRDPRRWADFIARLPEP